MTMISRLPEFTVILEKTEKDLLRGVTDEVHMSIVEGSPLTGAPGQPKDLGNLIKSWQKRFDGDSAIVSTNSEYAPYIEKGLRVVEKDGVSEEKKLTLRSEVGGFHSVSKTHAAFDRILEHVIAQVKV